MEKLIKNYCRDPILENFEKLESYVQTFLYYVSYYVENEHIITTGNQLLAKNTIKFYRFTMLPEQHKKIYRAIMLAIKYISMPEMEEHHEISKDTTYPKILIYNNSNVLLFDININSELTNQYNILIKSALDIHKELVLHEQELREEILSQLFKNGKMLNIDRIDIVYKKGDHTSNKIFFKTGKGVIKGNEDCYKCEKYMKKYDIDCSDTSKDASDKYKKLFLKYHPDKYKGKNPEKYREKFEQIKKCKNVCVDNKCISTIRHR